MADAKELKDFSVREMEIMAKAWNCFVEEPKVNYEKLASECGMTNVRSASNAWATIKKKIMARGGGGTGLAKSNGTSDDGHATPTKATPRKRSKKVAAEERDDAEVEASPAKKAKTPKKSKAKVDEDGESEAKDVKAEDDEEIHGGL